MLIDRGTDPDDYRSLRMSQGSGIFGVGVLVDEGGDDSYRAEAVSQGAGTFGIGLLLDLDGDDTHHAYQAAQGFAYARAAGLLYNGAGDDVYVMDVGDPEFGGDPLYGSAQRSGRAQSILGQGFAFGRRADFSDREFMSGGVGILADGAGNDRYEASIFAQGGGFWFGTGILADQGGNDTYDAIWYAMGTGAHYAMGLLLEGGGDDVYGGRLPRVNVTIGGAHDYTTAFLIDETGNDVYNLSRITGGAGNVNGIGFLVDNAGDDTYNTLNTYGLGGAGLLERGTMEPGVARRKVDTIGVFIDAAGMDNYVDKDGMPTMDEMNEGMWSHPQTSSDDPTKRARERGVGLDGTGESTLHVRW